MYYRVDDIISNAFMHNESIDHIFIRHISGEVKDDVKRSIFTNTKEIVIARIESFIDKKPEPDCKELLKDKINVRIVVPRKDCGTENIGVDWNKKLVTTFYATLKNTGRVVMAFPAPKEKTHSKRYHVMK